MSALDRRAFLKGPPLFAQAQRPETRESDELLKLAAQQLQWTMLVKGDGHTVSGEWLKASQDLYRRIAQRAEGGESK